MFFDRMGIRWEYEPRRLRLRDGYWQEFRWFLDDGEHSLDCATNYEGATEQACDCGIYDHSRLDYLPDFYLPDIYRWWSHYRDPDHLGDRGLWVEVKPDDSVVTSGYRDRLMHMIDYHETDLSRGFLLLGAVPRPPRPSEVIMPRTPLHSMLVWRKGVAVEHVSFDELLGLRDPIDRCAESECAWTWPDDATWNSHWTNSLWLPRRTALAYRAAALKRFDR